MYSNEERKKADDTHKRVVLGLDNAPWHKKAKILVEKELEYQDIPDRMTFVSIPCLYPPYSPDLNPIEQVENHQEGKVPQPFLA